MIETLQTTTQETHRLHPFCGLGGGAKDMNRASPRHQVAVGRTLQGKFRCVGGIDVNGITVALSV